MTDTAARANKRDSHTIIFKNREYEKFYKEYLQVCRYQDVYHKALVYCLGIDRDTRDHVKQIYDFKTGNVKPECLREGWQTSGSVKIVRLAFNLYCNGTPSVCNYDDSDTDGQLHEMSCYTVEEIMELLGCARQKAIRNIAELDTEKGIGLIEKKRLGLGKPNVIYVKNFMLMDCPEPEKEEKQPEIRRSMKIKLQEGCLPGIDPGAHRVPMPQEQRGGRTCGVGRGSPDDAG